MRTATRVILLVALAAVAAGVRRHGRRSHQAYTTSKPVVSNAPKKDRPFVTSGYITPKSTCVEPRDRQDHPLDEVRDGLGRHGHVLDEAVGRPAGGTKYSVTINIPMKGDHGVQAVQYRGGKQVSKSATRYFYVSRKPMPDPGQERVSRKPSYLRDALLLLVVVAVAVPAIVLGARALTGDGDMRSVGTAAASGSPVAVASPTGPPQSCTSCWVDKGAPAPAFPGEMTVVDGVQVLNVGLVGGYYRPNRFTVQAGVPVKVVFTGWAQDCLGQPEFPSSASRAT